MALSLGHLASLYNYDMEQYDKAEQLYLRSIAIGMYLGKHSVGIFHSLSNPQTKFLTDTDRHVKYGTISYLKQMHAVITRGGKKEAINM